jgi:PEP-CTERM motif
MDNLRIETNVVPEPSSLLSVILGAGGLLVRRRRVEG